MLQSLLKIKAILDALANDGIGDGRGDRNISVGLAELMLADSIQKTSRLIQDKAIRDEVHRAALASMSEAFGIISKSADEDGPICGNDLLALPPWLRHHGGSLQLQPWREVLAVDLESITLEQTQSKVNQIMDLYGYSDQVVIADMLRQCAALTRSEAVYKTLISKAPQIMSANTSAGAAIAFDERCGSTGQRIHIPIPKGNKVEFLQNN